MAREPSTDAPPRIAAGTPAFRRTNVAIFSCGFSIFALLYCTQPVLPLFSQEFGVSAAESSLALSLTTITMAVAMLFASSLSEVVGRKPLMLWALVASCVLTLVLAAAPQWSHILWLRALTGITLSGMPAVALAYLGEEMEPQAVAPAVGLYIGGGAFGGMTGRLVV
ncbi:MAG TPA: MFS transporter, partial [Beijerinckiaceae bacterium]